MTRKPRETYSSEFKREAVVLLEQGDISWKTSARTGIANKKGKKFELNEPKVERRLRGND